MRKLTLFLIATVTTVVTGLVGAAERDFPAGDPRRDASNVLRTIPLDDGSLLLISRSRTDEPHAMVARLIERDEVAAEFRAADFLPPDAVNTASAGQIFGGAKLDDGRLALSIGWTNRKGRNVNGIALLARDGGGWRGARVIVLRGSVRDLAAGPGGGIVAATTDVLSDGRARLAVLFLHGSGAVGRTLYQRISSIDEAEKGVFSLRLQRAGTRSVAMFDLSDGTAHVYDLDVNAACAAAVETRGHAVFLYPANTAANCDGVKLSRLLSLGDAPSDAAGLQRLSAEAARLHPDGSLSVVWQGYDGRAVQTFLQTHGARTATRRLPPMLLPRSVWLSEDVVVAAYPSGSALRELRVPLRGNADPQ